MQRDFNLRRLGQLTLDVRCVDLFNTNKTDAVIYGIRELTVHNPARRTKTGCASAIRASSIALGLHRPCSRKPNDKYETGNQSQGH